MSAQTLVSIRTLEETVRFRRMPERVPGARYSDSEAAQVARCNARCGHILVVHQSSGEICCRMCPATWRNEGF